ncbi:MAG: hypothetical protein ACWGHH_02645 [Sulfurovaceae bacterium]
MKKTLLLSIVASTMIMAGGDIAPVEPAVVTPAPVVESNWKFSGTAAVVYQTDDAHVSSRGVTSPMDDSLFSQGASAANAGLQLRASNADLIAGIGFGAELTGLGTLGLEEDVVSDVMQTAGNPFPLNAAYFSELYLTYGIANTSLKVGRQELPKALSPFAYSEDWNVFSNTFDAVLLVNTDLPDTVLVGAWVRSLNDYVLGVTPVGLHAHMANFDKINGSDGVFMLTAQNKSIADLTLTGSWYFGSDFTANDDLNILWGDAQYNAGFANIALQGGAVMNDDIDDTKAFGAMISGKLDMINAHVAYAHVNDSSLGMFNTGGSTSALYTDTALNQVDNAIAANLNNDMDKFVIAANADVLGGNLAAVYAYEDNGSDFNEVNVVYSTNITNDLSAALAYVYSDVVAGDVNLIRAVAKYNF